MASTYYSEVDSSSNSMTKVFGWMFLAILVTAAVAFGLPYFLVAINAAEAYYPLLIGGVIATVVLSFLGQFVIAQARSKALAVTVFLLFAASMGIWISPLVLLYDLGTLVYALFTTSAVFGIMAVYGAVTKRDLSGFGSFMIMLLLGCLIVSIFNIFIANTTLDWFLSYIILAVYIGFIAFDVQRVKRLSQSGQMNTNIALLMALNLYVDFVYIFIRLVAIIGRNRD